MPGLTPEAILAIHKGYADEFAALAVGGLGAAYRALTNSNIYRYVPSQINITSPIFGTPRTFTDQLPTLPPDPTIPALGSLFGFEPTPASNFGTAPAPRYGNAPVYSAPVKPQGGVPRFTGQEPDLESIGDFGPIPTYLSLPPLNLASVNIPTAPVFQEPTFEGRRPNDIAAVDPNAIVAAYSAEQQSHRGLLTSFIANNANAFIAAYAPEYNALRTRINNNILAYTDPTTGGGTGVPTQIEGAIYARNTTRANEEYQSALESAADDLGKRGWTIPGGALLASMQDARMKMGDALVGNSAEIAIKNVELEQKQFQFIYEKAADIETKMLATITDYLKLGLEIDQQSIESAKQIVSAYLGAYNIQVLVYKAMWDGYQADAQVLTAKVGVLEARARLYNSQVEGELAKSKNNQAQADVIKAIADVNSSMAQAYKVQIEAALAPLEIEKLRVTLFGARAQVYTAEVQGWEAAFKGFSAEIEGEIAKQKAFEVQVGAFKEETLAWKAKVEAYSAQVTSVSEINKARTAYNDGQIRVWSGQADQAIKIYEGGLTAYKAKSDVILEETKTEIEYWKAQASLIQTQWSTSLQQTFEFAREQMNLFRGQMEAAVQAGNGLAHAASVSGNLAGSAMSGLTSFAGNLVSS